MHRLAVGWPGPWSWGRLQSEPNSPFKVSWASLVSEKHHVGLRVSLEHLPVTCFVQMAPPQYLLAFSKALWGVVWRSTEGVPAGTPSFEWRGLQRLESECRRRPHSSLRTPVQAGEGRGDLGSEDSSLAGWARTWWHLGAVGEACHLWKILDSSVLRERVEITYRLPECHDLKLGQPGAFY